MFTLKSAGAILRKILLEIGVVALLIIGISIYNDARNFETASNLVQHTNTVLTNIYNLMTLIERVETKQREYLASQKPHLKESYDRAELRLKAEIEKIRELVVDNKAQEKRIQALSSEIFELSRRFEPVLSQQAARAKFEFNPALIEKIRDLTHELAYEERKLLVVRAEKAQEIANEIGFSVIVGGALALILLLVSRFIIRSDYNSLKAKDTKLQERSLLLNSVVQNMSEGVLMVNAEGQFTIANPAAERLLGTQILSTPVTERSRRFGLYRPGTDELLDWKELPLARALSGIDSDDCEVKLVNALHPKGLVISVSGRSLRQLDGKVVGGIAVIRDITKRKAAEEEWIRAREAAIEGSKLKSDFLASISHEIRTPMNGIIGMATLLADTRMSSEQFDFVTTIKKSAEALLSLINSILDHSKMEAKKLTLDNVNFDLNQMTTDVIEMFKYSAGEKSIRLELELSDSIKYVLGDAGRIRQILINLIGNAVKFTQMGGVFVKVSNEAQAGEKVRIKFEVRDTGMGMTPEDQAHLFQKYSQTNKGAAYGGTGLGLAISAQLAELMGGKMGVTSELDKGSTFWLEVTLDKVAALEKVPAQEPLTEKFSGHVLIVEDQLINQRVVKKYLEKLGLTADIAENGQRGLELYKKSEYSLILMDCKMPIMDGYKASAAIRLMESNRSKRTPIIALTAEGYSGDRAKCFEAGMDDFLSKPLEFPKLQVMLKKWLSSGELEVAKSKTEVAPILKETVGGEIDVSILNRLREYSVKDRDLISVLIEDFAQSTPQTLKAMRNALSEKRMEELSDLAHGLKSGSGSLGATQFSELCHQIETLESLEPTAEQLVSQLELKFEKVLAELLTIHPAAPKPRKVS